MTDPTMQARARVRKIIAAELGKHAEGITDDMTLFDLGADSLDVIAIDVELEGEFAITLDDAEVQQAQTVGEVIAIVERVLGEREAA
jgi:acyl carrier protein